MAEKQPPKAPARKPAAKRTPAKKPAAKRTATKKPSSTRRRSMPNNFEPKTIEVKKGAGGRPTKYEPWMCDVVLDVGARGGSKTEMAVEIGVHRGTIYRWSEENAEFCDAIARALEISQVWWEINGRTAIFFGGKSFSGGTYEFMLKNQFREDYRDSKEVDHTTNGQPLTVALLPGDEDL